MTLTVQLTRALLSSQFKDLIIWTPSKITGPGAEPVREPLKLLSIWGEVIRQFSERRLTNWTDRLAAVQGVVVALAEAFPGCFALEDYMFGMWRQHMDRLLTWYRVPFDGNWQKEGDEGAGLKAALSSWSWAGVSGSVDYYPYAWNPESMSLIRILGIEYEISTDIMLGGGPGTITVSGLLIPTCGQIDEIMAEFDPPHEFPLTDTFKSPDTWAMDPTLGIELDDPADELSWLSITHFLPLIREAGDSPKTQGIFLASIEGRDNTFRRVGYHYDYGCNIYLEREEEAEAYRTVFSLI
ncbi:hypothetical protein EDB80DRAFT_829424 [Ilyonectria destructans]|nr:hypothetical protein EDB80DRAFT_829424 [Ilyonectria destructans]